MDYKAKIIELINLIDDERRLAFIYGLLDEIIRLDCEHDTSKGG